MFPVNKSGIGLQNLVNSAKDKYNSYLPASYDLIGPFTGKWAFLAADHIQEVKGERLYWGKF